MGAELVGGEVEVQVLAGLEEHRVEHLLDRRLGERRHAVLRREEGEEERQAEVGRRAVNISKEGSSRPLAFPCRQAMSTSRQVDYGVSSRRWRAEAVRLALGGHSRNVANHPVVNPPRAACCVSAVGRFRV